jgi:hypothetical protein
LPTSIYASAEEVCSVTFFNWSSKTAEESVAIKLHRYLLNPEHINVRGHLTGKAVWFRDNLCFTRYNAGELVKQIRFNRLRAKVDKLTVHGQKYREIIKILGANGRIKRIEFVWIENLDGVIRLVTIKGFPKYEKND